MDRSAIILAGGSSKRFGKEKGLIPILEKPLIKYVLDAVSGIVHEKIVVVSSKTQAETYRRILGSDTCVTVDSNGLQAPLVGAREGFEKARGEYSLLLPCDAPLVSKDILVFLFELCEGKNAVVPRWPNTHIEPLQAVYHRETALTAARNALDKGEVHMRSMLSKLSKVRYVSTLVLRQLDPELKTFLNINTPRDLESAESILKSLNTYSNC